MLVSSRYGVLYPDPNRLDGADGPRDLLAMVGGVEQSAMYVQGLFSARPGASIQGRLYAATDLSKLYYDTGSAWFDAFGPHGVSHSHVTAPGSSDPLDDFEYAFSNWKTVLSRAASFQSATVGITKDVKYAWASSGLFMSSASSWLNAGQAGVLFYLDPADWSAGRDTQFRLKCALATNGTAPSGNAGVPGPTITIKLWRVTGWSGGIATLTEELSSASVQPIDNAIMTFSGSPDSIAAGTYCMGLIVTGTNTVAGSGQTYTGILQVRQI